MVGGGRINGQNAVGLLNVIIRFTIFRYDLMPDWLPSGGLSQLEIKHIKFHKAEQSSLSPVDYAAPVDKRIHD